MSIVIGGVQYFTPFFGLKKSRGYIKGLTTEFSKDYNVNFTFGGYFSLLAIIDNMAKGFTENSVVLLPSYLCPSILKPFQIRNIKYKFYKVDAELFVDVEHLASLLDEQVKAVLFIDYFGASQIERLGDILKELKSRTISVIQDVVQCLEIKKEFLFGDYIFNSFRKFFPFEGSILLSKTKMDIAFSKKKNLYLGPKRMGQFLRYLHIEHHLLSSSHFLKHIKKSEDCYHTAEILPMPARNKRMLDKYDVKEMATKRIGFAARLNKLLATKTPALFQLRGFAPLGFEIKIQNRDQVRRYLFDQNIFAPVHWTLSDEIDARDFAESVKLSKEILTIPLGNMDEAKLEYMIKHIQLSLAS